ncbi:autoinducer binding domain-containing protein [Rhizobium sp. BT-226]|uniref:autoinducer binding domain-containing protein n=1 Tax=Rhizobium sp. BT-226 TaxID=2986922 RepID=UPI0021F71A27|nr:autoinducer binding domain-containing protein [Rhizobium sp. BT-226]MCW0021320.1 autoinducer binding domain-containing protein [Rhizobium sp. BT-226]
MKIATTKMNHWFERLTEQVALSHDEAAVQATLEKLTTGAGFQFFAYLSLQEDARTAISNYNKEWQRRYFKQRFALIDPVVSKARQNMEAFAWSNEISSRMTKKHKAFFGEAAEFGIRSGISIPISTGFGWMAMLTLACEDAGFAERQELNPVLAAAAVGQMHARIERMRVSPNPNFEVQLKVEELTCLRWSAEGKPMKAIAIIENTTYSNVCFFIRNAKAALGVTTLPQATARAKELGLI